MDNQELLHAISDMMDKKLDAWIGSRFDGIDERYLNHPCETGLHDPVIHYIPPKPFCIKTCLGIALFPQVGRCEDKARKPHACKLPEHPA